MKSVLIGCGVISNTHTDVLLKLGQEITAVCDIDYEKAKKHCEKFGLDCRIYQDYKEMLEKENPDVAHVLTPHYLHCEMVVEILGRNINCLCEKPLFIKENEYALIKEAVKKSNATLGVCFQHRYLKVNQYIKNAVEREGFVGASIMLAWHKDEAYYKSGDWRGKFETEGGALLINQAIHSLDQLCWIGGEPDKICASLTTHTLADFIEAEDTAELFFEHKNGAVSQIFATNSAVANFNGLTCLKTEAATYEYNSKYIYRNNKIVNIDDDSVSIDTKAYWGYGHYHLIKDYYSCINDNKPFPIDFREASKAIKLVLEAYKSNRQTIEIK